MAIWFKAAFIVAFIYAVAVASATARGATRRHGGTFNQLQHEVRGLIVVRALLGLVFYAMLFVWLFRAESPTWARIPTDARLQWTAVALLLPALAFFTWAFRSLGANYRGGVGLYPAHTLVTDGAYRWIRHPIYAAFIVIMVLVLVITANWVIGLSGWLLVVSIAAARMPIEERELGERFGASWDTYVNRTGRLLPRVHR